MIDVRPTGRKDVKIRSQSREKLVKTRCMEGSQTGAMHVPVKNTEQKNYLHVCNSIEIEASYDL